MLIESTHKHTEWRKPSSLIFRMIEVGDKICEKLISESFNKVFFFRFSTRCDPPRAGAPKAHEIFGFFFVGWVVEFKTPAPTLQMNECDIYNVVFIM